MKTKYSKVTVRAFSTIITIKTRPIKNWCFKGNEFAREFQKICRTQRIHIYSTMKETKPGFVECTTRSKKVFTVIGETRVTRKITSYPKLSQL